MVIWYPLCLDANKLIGVLYYLWRKLAKKA
jgi:hypothetical protein